MELLIMQFIQPPVNYSRLGVNTSLSTLLIIPA
jgi:hypothetical protein